MLLVRLLVRARSQARSQRRAHLHRLQESPVRRLVSRVLQVHSRVGPLHLRGQVNPVLRHRDPQDQAVVPPVALNHRALRNHHLPQVQARNPVPDLLDLQVECHLFLLQKAPRHQANRAVNQVQLHRKVSSPLGTLCNHLSMI